MAKNLKIHIKNAQLAEALKQNKLKKEKKESFKKNLSPESSKEKSSPKGEKEPLSLPQKEKKIVRARKFPSNFCPPPPKKEELPQSPSPDKKPLPEKQAPKENKEPSQVTEKKTEGAKPPIFVEKEKPKKISPANIRKQAFNRVFDSQHKKGLRIGEDEVWRRKKHANKAKAKTFEELETQRPKEITVQLPKSVKELAALMKLKSSQLIQKLFLQGITLTINDFLDDPTIVELIGHEFNCTIHIDTSQKDRLQVTGKSIEAEIKETVSDKLEKRPPIVTVMGHVDHGKTSIIDAFRTSNLIAQESGSITQHIGAFRCQTKQGSFTVLDTPGHEAFSSIRQRGANVTDIILLVIAGDEGIMAQTKEAIEKAKEAKVPIIVAINKKDKPNFNVESVYRQLSDHDLLPEAWGGEMITVCCSAKTKEGIEQLAEMISLQSDILELKANPNARGRGTVLESQIHQGLGPTATLLVQNGTLHVGDAIIFEREYGKIKTMQDEYGEKLQKAPPSTPVRVTGLSGVPLAGNEFIALDNEKEARKIAKARQADLQSFLLRQGKRKDVENLLQQKMLSQKQKVLNIVLKADVMGSLDAVETTIKSISTKKILVHFVSRSVGQITQSDIEFAEASKGIIIAFHTGIENKAEPLIKKKGIPFFSQNVIYHLLEDIKKYMLTLLDKISQEVQIGEATVLATFKSSQVGTIAGCLVEDGIIKRSSQAKLFRNKEQIFAGSIASLKRLKEDVKEVKKGLECGLLLNGFSHIQEGDTLKTFETTYKDQEL